MPPSALRWALATALLFSAIICGHVTSAADSPPTAAAPAVAEHLTHGRFRNIAIYAPVGTPNSFVLFLSGDRGWDSITADMALKFVRRGALVAGIDLRELKANLEADSAECVFLDGDLENLSHFLQAYHHLPTYLAPFLVGYDSGASLAYAALAQAPANTFAGALTAGFCPTSNLRKPLCTGSGIQYSRPPGDHGVQFLPVKKLENPWVLIEGDHDQVCGPTAAGDFIAGMPGAALVQVRPSNWLPPFMAAFDTLVKRSSSMLALPPPLALKNLPIIEIPARAAAPSTDAFAIIMSGDGGWAGLDKEVASALSAQGIPVVGLDSLRYFWNARTPDGLASDTDQMIRYYLAHLGKKRVLLIGYSQGADVLPFAVNRLPAATRAQVGLTVLMGMSQHALFEFHVSSWISDDDSGPATLPEVTRITGTPVLCIYGEGDNDSLCPKLDPGKVRIVKLNGGHHFNGDYAGLAREILAASNR